jgi:hypothetical protein
MDPVETVLMPNIRLVILGWLIVAALPLVFPHPADGAGPWAAQAVSAATKRPLRDVVVVAFWTKNVQTESGPTSEYRYSEETVTDRDGRFTVASRSFFSFHPLVSFRGPFFVFFKPGYGPARPPAHEVGPQAYDELLEHDGIVLEMSPLHTVEERSNYLKKIRDDSRIVPREDIPLLTGAIAKERQTITLK